MAAPSNWFNKDPLEASPYSFSGVGSQSGVSPAAPSNFAPTGDANSWRNLANYGVNTDTGYTPGLETSGGAWDNALSNNLSAYDQAAEGDAFGVGNLAEDGNLTGFDWEGAIGKFGSVAKGIGALSSAWLGWKNYGLAKQAVKDQNAQWAKNYAAQRATTNNAISERNANLRRRGHSTQGQLVAA